METVVDPYGHPLMISCDGMYAAASVRITDLWIHAGENMNMHLWQPVWYFSLGRYSHPHPQENTIAQLGYLTAQSSAIIISRGGYVQHMLAGESL